MCSWMRLNKSWLVEGASLQICLERIWKTCVSMDPCFAGNVKLLTRNIVKRNLAGLHELLCGHLGMKTRATC